MASQGGNSTGGMGGMNITHPWDQCIEVTPWCPVEATTLGYYPNLGINVFFAVGFGIATITAFSLGVWKKTWSYMSFITAGCALELAGYGARAALHFNPWNQQAFQTQICAIILAPTLLCISIYLTLKHVCLSMSPSLSRIPPRSYPFIFVPADVSCLLVQAIGGSLAASAGSNNMDLLQSGNRTIIAGVALQVVVLLFFGITALDYWRRVKRSLASGQAPEHMVTLWTDKRFRQFAWAVIAAYSMIMIRCIYRIAEMSGGWGSEIMQDEPSFIVLEGFMVLIPVLLLAFFNPGIFFPDMGARMAMKPSEKKRVRREARAERKAEKAARKAGSGPANASANANASSSSSANGGEVVAEKGVVDVERGQVA